MITKKTIKSIYRRYRKSPADIDDLNVGALFQEDMSLHKVKIDDGKLVIGSLDSRSPFRAIPLSGVNAIVNFDRHVAIVLHSSIIFLGRGSSAIDVHVKMERPSVIERLRYLWAEYRGLTAGSRRGSLPDEYAISH